MSGGLAGPHAFASAVQGAKVYTVPEVADAYHCLQWGPLDWRHLLAPFVLQANRTMKHLLTMIVMMMMMMMTVFFLLLLLLLLLLVVTAVNSSVV